MIRDKRLTIFYYIVRISMVILISASIIGIFIRRDDADLSRGIFVAIQAIILLLLSFGPPAMERRLKLDIPDFLEGIFLIFIIAALIFGEVAEFFVKVSWWDDMLHTTSGVLVAITSFSIINTAVKNPNNALSLNPFFIALFVFCFSMTIGVIWEFFEFAIDSLTGTSNMMRTYDSLTNIPFQGLSAVSDTIHDLFLASLSSLAVSIIGYFDAKHGMKFFKKWLISSHKKTEIKT